MDLKKKAMDPQQCPCCNLYILPAGIVLIMWCNVLF